MKALSRLDLRHVLQHQLSWGLNLPCLCLVLRLGTLFGLKREIKGKPPFVGRETIGEARSQHILYVGGRNYKRGGGGSFL